MGDLSLVARPYFFLDVSLFTICCSPISRVDANVVSLIGVGLEVNTGGGGEGVQTTLDDGHLMGSCRGLDREAKEQAIPYESYIF